MTELGHGLDLLCSNLTAETGLICLHASLQAANCDGFIISDSRNPPAPATEILLPRLQKLTADSQGPCRGAGEKLCGCIS